MPETRASNGSGPARNPSAASAAHTCARCGRSGRRREMIYSRHTGNWYCVHVASCDERVRVKRAGQTARGPEHGG